MNTKTLNSIKSIENICGISKLAQYDYPIRFSYEAAQEVKKAIKKLEKSLTNQDIRLVTISTTAFDDEDFILLTDLTDKKIEAVIKPIVDAEREGEGEDNFYDNEALFWALKDKYPNNIISMYTESDIECLTI
jgi:hypothetical protein